MILVTGGMGFIGSHAVQALAELGHGCVVTSRRTTRDLGENISIEQVDVADRDAMVGLGHLYAIGGIVHLADPALTHLGDPSASPATLLADMRAGADALFNVLECAIAWDVQRVTIASSMGVYGGVPDLRGVNEELPLVMTAGNVVAASKKGAELVAAIKRVVPNAVLPLEPGRSPHGAVAYLDTTRLQADTHFEPEYDLNRALADYVSWLTTG